MLRTLRLLAICCFTTTSSPVASADDAVVRVVDTGPGLCCAIMVPGDDGPHYAIYDAGHYRRRGAVAFQGIQEVIPAGSVIDLMVLSHSDADHLGAVKRICDAYTVKRVVRPGWYGERRGGEPTGTWTRADRAIGREVRDEGCVDIQLSQQELPPGSTYRVGNGFMTIICGFAEPPAELELSGRSERNNGGSIITRLLYEGRSMMFCGDAVGRHNGDPPDALLGTERFALEYAAVIDLDSDVMVAAHHGADNGSSTAFIAAVDPRFVIFSAGHEYEHPRFTTYRRFLAHGEGQIEFFRTDRGDHEGGRDWWDAEEFTEDEPGDDDIIVTLPGVLGEEISVEYANPE